MELSRGRQNGQRRSIARDGNKTETHDELARKIEQCSREHRRHVLMLCCAACLASLLAVSTTLLAGMFGQLGDNMTSSESAKALLTGGNVQSGIAVLDGGSDTLPDDFYLLLLGVARYSAQKPGLSLLSQELRSSYLFLIL